jgi:hypothetical protein
LNVVARNGLDLRNRTSIEPVALTPTPKIEDEFEDEIEDD